jgi:hypothetical protein
VQRVVLLAFLGLPGIAVLPARPGGGKNPGRDRDERDEDHAAVVGEGQQVGGPPEKS